MMCLNCMNHGFVFAEPLGVFHAKLHMRAVELVVKRLSDIVQRPARRAVLISAPISEAMSPAM
mgnify:CR=1 FL=1